MRILGMIMAGGKGERLYPLTKDRSKPSVPFGGKYRIVDFVLSNFVNSGIFSSYVLVQYLSQSLIEYLRTTWRSEGIIPDHFLTCVPPQMRLGEIWYLHDALPISPKHQLGEGLRARFGSHLRRGPYLPYGRTANGGLPLKEQGGRYRGRQHRAAGTGFGLWRVGYGRNGPHRAV